MAAGLSGREEEVLALVAQGLTNAQVAERLGISPLTVKKHLERMYDASGVRNRAELVARTYRRSEPRRAAALPAPLTSFIGRERELAEVLRLIEKHRLLTLGGPGGIGKTRLATVAGAAAGERFRDGVHIVELASLSDARLVASAVAAALGVPDRSTSRVAAIVAALREKEALLILDNCEHVVAPAAELAAEILRGSGAVRVLATSREPLGIPGEAFWPVPPLTLPEPARSRVVDIAQSEAVRLFIERAALRVPAFDLTADNARAVASICRGLDGVPLAIELAAARLNVLSVEEINARLADRFRELRSDDAAVTPRHRTLRSVVEWSHQLLAPLEALLFERLAVFSGGFTLAAAERVCTDERIAPQAVLDLVSRLVDKSFVIANVRGEIARYQMLETLQRYAREQVGTSGDLPRLARRHAEFFCALAEEAEPKLKGPEQIRWAALLEDDHDNLRAALGWSFANDPVLGARIAAALWRFWFHRGHRVEGISWLERALLVADLPLPVRGRVLNAAGNLGAGLDRMRSEQLHRENLAIQRRLGTPSVWDFTAALSNLGDRLRERGAIDEARALYMEALPLRAGDPWGLALTTSQLGHIALDEGVLDEAARCYGEAIRLWRVAGDRIRAAAAITFAARIAREQGRYARALELYRRAMVLHRGLGDRYALARDLVLFSLALKAAGDTRASRFFAAGVAAHAEFAAEVDAEQVDVSLLTELRADLARQEGGGPVPSLSEAVAEALAVPGLRRTAYSVRDGVTAGSRLEAIGGRNES